MQKNKSHDKVKLTGSGKKAIFAQFRWIIISSLVFFVSAWNINVLRAWIYFSVNFGCTLISTMIFIKVIPELANRRGEVQEGTKKWDKILIMLYFLGVLLIIPLFSGLDIRFNWFLIQTNTTLIIGICLYIISFVFFQWTIIVNKYFEGTARIQSEMDHQVIEKGPYSLIRHPGYLGMFIGGISFPLIVGSFWGLIAYIPFTVVLIVRTSLEDKMLVDELEGYKIYTVKTKYRLIPFIW